MTKTAALILYYKRLIEYLVLNVWGKVVMRVTSQKMLLNQCILYVMGMYVTFAFGT